MNFISEIWPLTLSSKGRRNNYAFSLWADRVPYLLLDTGRWKNEGKLEQNWHFLNSPPAVLKRRGLGG